MNLPDTYFGQKFENEFLRAKDAPFQNHFGRLMCFQYVVAMNEDDASEEAVLDFDLSNRVLRMVLIDAVEDGGLFGFRS